jgi:hypothetical protein
MFFKRPVKVEGKAWDEVWGSKEVGQVVDLGFHGYKLLRQLGKTYERVIFAGTGRILGEGSEAQISQRFFKLLGVDPKVGTITKGVRPKPEFPNASMHFIDVGRYPNRYIFDSPKILELMLANQAEVDFIVRYLETNGISLTRKVQTVVAGKTVWKEVSIKKTYEEGAGYIPALVVEKVLPGGGVITRRLNINPLKEAKFEIKQAGVEAGFRYAATPLAIRKMWHWAVKEVADKKIYDWTVKELGLTVDRKIASVFPHLAESHKVGTATLKRLVNADKALNRMIRGERLAPATLSAIERLNPEWVKLVRAGSLRQAQKEIRQTIAEVKAELGPIRQAYREQVKLLRSPTFSEGMVQWGDFTGRYLPIQFAEAMKAKIAREYGPTNQWVMLVAGTPRMMMAAIDISWGLIQGYPVLVTRPDIWATSMGKSLHGLVDSRVFAKEIDRHFASAIELVNHGGYLGSFEYFEVMPRLQALLEKMPKALGKPGLMVLNQGYGQFSAAFGGWGDLARIYMWEAMAPMVAKEFGEVGLHALGRNLNLMTGTLTWEGLGIGPNQRAFETSWAFFAPRYTRAASALMLNTLRGGVDGKLARETLAKMMVGALIMYVGTGYAIGQKP